MTWNRCQGCNADLTYDAHYVGCPLRTKPAPTTAAPACIDCGAPATTYLESSTHILDMCAACLAKHEAESERLKVALEAVEKKRRQHLPRGGLRRDPTHDAIKKLHDRIDRLIADLNAGRWR